MKISMVRSAAVLSVAAVLVGLTVTPAVATAAATPGALSAGSSLFAVDCDEGPIGQIYSIDVSNADATAVGSGSNIENANCAGGGAWDYSTNTMYYIAYSPGAYHAYLASVNLTTGVSSELGFMGVSGVGKNINAMAIGLNGSAYAIDSAGELYSLDLSSGALTAVAATGDNHLYGFAVSPITGVYYVLDYNTGVYSTINLSTGALTAVGTLSLLPNTSPESLQIDVNGTFWVENDGVNSDIWSFDPAAPSGAVESGVVTLAGSQVYTETLLLLPGSIAPTITSPAPAASIPTSTAFSFTVTAMGTAPISFSITAGSLPPGLALNSATGVISGTPTTAGAFSYTVTATNAGGTSAIPITQLVTAAIHLPIVSG